ncbi:MAG: hypothetical protein ACOX7D_01805 [Alphaproteobacteria bacterium]|jgi:hypothetical protein|nr:hypothetical protein [Alphaproteobacteria bacterium]
MLISKGIKKLSFALIATVFLITSAMAGELQTVYVDVPAVSYYAYPDDPNFVPETEFMQRTDSLNYDDNIIAAQAEQRNAMPGVRFTDRPAVVCRDFGCTRLNDRITRTFLFNSLSGVFMTNTNSQVHICEADPFSRICLQSGISFPVRVGIANAMVKIPQATITQVNISTGLSKSTIGMSFDFLVNGISVQCAPALVDLVIPANAQATLATREFSCNMTTDGLTNVSLLINVDYIDLDFGLIGGYYSLGLQGPAIGGGTGYALFKMEFANKGMRMRTATENRKSNEIIIQPGEYAVEPVQK